MPDNATDASLLSIRAQFGRHAAWCAGSAGTVPRYPAGRRDEPYFEPGANSLTADRVITQIARRTCPSDRALRRNRHD
jgi:hypothetical protein